MYPILTFSLKFKATEGNCDEDRLLLGALDFIGP